METVVLLHGIGHTKLNMLGAEWAMKRFGYNTLNLSYPSRHNKIEDLSDFVHEKLTQKNIWKNEQKIHFLTHSMGGLVARAYLKKYKDQIPADKLGRIVMIAPPNMGSEVADLLKTFPPYRWIFGPAGQQLTTRYMQIAEDEIYYELGIIAGSRGWPYILGNMAIPGPHDGRVSVKNAQIKGMKDHLTIPATHSFISWMPRILRQADYFFKYGKFQNIDIK